MKTLKLSTVQVAILHRFINLQRDCDATIDVFNYNYKGGKKEFKEDYGFTIQQLRLASGGDIIQGKLNS